MSEPTQDQPQLTCHYHPQRAALVRCGSCDKPLCPECVQHGPVGTRCVECLFGIVIRPVSIARRFAAAGAALATALALASALGHVGLLNWWTSLAMGMAVGQVSRTIVHRATIPAVQTGAGVAAALGAYWGMVVQQVARAGGSADALVRAAAHIQVGEWGLAGLLAAGMAIYWARRP